MSWNFLNCLELELEAEEVELQSADIERQIEDVQAKIQATKQQTQQDVEKIDARFKEVGVFNYFFFIFYSIGDRGEGKYWQFKIVLNRDSEPSHPNRRSQILWIQIHLKAYDTRLSD